MIENFIEEKEVTIESVANLFKSAFIRVSESDESDEFIINLDSLAVHVFFYEERKMIRFYVFFPIDNKSYEEALSIVSDAKRERILARCYIEKYEDSMFWLADYCISYEMGIIPFQVVNMAKLFGQSSRESAREFFEIE